MQENEKGLLMGRGTKVNTPLGQAGGPACNPFNYYTLSFAVSSRATEGPHQTSILGPQNFSKSYIHRESNTLFTGLTTLQKTQPFLF
jgi:hypothetical protein